MSSFGTIVPELVGRLPSLPPSLHRHADAKGASTSTGAEQTAKAVSTEKYNQICCSICCSKTKPGPEEVEETTAEDHYQSATSFDD